MYDNKVRLSRDVLEKAEHIAHEWGLKNARAAVEAVFRRYADDYLYGRHPSFNPSLNSSLSSATFSYSMTPPDASADCEALNELDDLLGST